MIHSKTFYINADKQYINNSNGFKLPFTPELYVNDNLILKFIIKDNNGTPVNLSGYTFKAAFDYSFTYNNADLVTIDNSLFNISGDWSQTDASSGRICCRCNNTPAIFANYMDAEKIKIAYFDLWAISGSNKPTLLAQFKINIRNPISKYTNYNVGGIGYMSIGGTFRIG